MALAIERPSGLPDLESRHIVGMRVDATSYEDAARRVAEWAKAGESRYVCVASVNNVMHARDDESYRQIMNAADLVTPDGMPLVWGLKALGVPHATRTYGPTLTPIVCELAAREGIPVAFYGGTPEILERFEANLLQRYPRLRIAYSWPPPFRALTAEEDAQVVRDIRASGARIVFVGLGTPKQEQWMIRRRGELAAVMLGVGAAFDFIAGEKKQAPAWMQSRGLEWLFRLVTEPRRLWKRYLVSNPRYVALFARQLLRTRFLKTG
ncbi:MAG TPA: WecB/TagA/CpsF family glycosyltransferase [Actinomycetota bacterium]|nr:WecB/TagA/CpsF family glycosyltransferase [Actinomycetota bacterium]